MAKREEIVVGEIGRWLKKQNDVWGFKTHGFAFQKVGLPDFILCVNGRFVGPECKAVGKMRAPIQVYVAGKIKKAGGITGRIDNFDEFIAMIEQARNLP